MFLNVQAPSIILEEIMEQDDHKLSCIVANDNSF